MRLITSAAVLAFAAHAQDDTIDFIPASEVGGLAPLTDGTVPGQGAPAEKTEYDETIYVTSALPTEFFGWMDLSMGFLFGLYVPI